MGPRTRLRTITLSLIPTLVILVILEVGVRIAISCASGHWQPLYYGSAELHRFLFEDKAAIVRRQRTFYVEHEPVDPARFDLTKGAVIRGRYVTFQAPPGTRRLLVFGASSVYGVTGPAEQSFPARLEQRLNEPAGPVRFDVVNLGVPGKNSEEFRMVRQPEGFRFEHDIELFYFVHNDLLLPLIASSRSALAWYKLHNALYRLSAFYSAMVRLWMRCRGAAFTTGAAARLSVRYLDNVEAMIRSAQARGITVALVTEAVDVTYLSATDSVYRTFVAVYEKSLAGLKALAARYHLDVIDAQHALYDLQTPSQRRRLFYDEVHLTEEGNAALADLVAGRLRALHPDWFHRPAPR